MSNLLDFNYEIELAPTWREEYYSYNYDDEYEEMKRWDNGDLTNVGFWWNESGKCTDENGINGIRVWECDEKLSNDGYARGLGPFPEVNAYDNLERLMLIESFVRQHLIVDLKSNIELHLIYN
jgi:hypothetical protein